MQILHETQPRCDACTIVVLKLRHQVLSASYFGTKPLSIKLCNLVQNFKRLRYYLIKILQCAVSSRCHVYVMHKQKFYTAAIRKLGIMALDWQTQELSGLRAIYLQLSDARRSLIHRKLQSQLMAFFSLVFQRWPPPRGRPDPGDRRPASGQQHLPPAGHKYSAAGQGARRAGCGPRRNKHG